jgi:hypothetical protein
VDGYAGGAEVAGAEVAGTEPLDGATVGTVVTGLVTVGAGLEEVGVPGTVVGPGASALVVVVAPGGTELGAELAGAPGAPTVVAVELVGAVADEV